MHDTLIRWWNGISLRTKVTGVTVFLLTTGLVVAGAGTMSALGQYMMDEVDRQLYAAAKDVSASEDLADASGLNPFYLATVNSDGQLINDNLRDAQRALAPDVSRLTLLYVSNDIDPVTLVNASHTVQWRVVALPARTTGTGEQVTILIGLNLSSNTALINRYAAIFLFFGMSVVILGGALTRLLVTSTFAPLRDVEATAARFAAGDFSQRLDADAPNTEVGRLNRSLNAMLARIDQAFADRAKTIDQMRRFVGDASHELRTPLVSVRGYAELYRMGALTKPEDVAQAMERIEKEAIRMGELVSDLLELARIDEAKPLQLTAVDLIPLARDAALDSMASAPDRVVTVVATEQSPPEVVAGEADATTRAPTVAEASAAAMSTGPIAFAGATLARLRAMRARQARPVVAEPVALEPPAASATAIVSAEENKIRQVLTNLIGNALRFSPDGSPIEIGVEANEATGFAVLSVIDHGEGIPPQIREKIFQRFWRADNSRNRDTGGSGLGLAIVASIVAAHKGSVDVVETPGGGATFRVSLPLLKQGAAA